MAQEKSDYYDLQTELFRMYQRKRNFWIFLAISIIFGVITIYFGIRDHLSIVSIIIATLFVMFIAFFILALMNIVWINMNQSDYEERIVKKRQSV